MVNRSSIIEDDQLVLLVQEYYDIIIVAVSCVGLSFVVWKFGWRKIAISGGGGFIPGRLGLPFLGETFSFLSASSSSKGCYDFVRHRRLRHGKWFKTRIFGKTHVFVPTAEGARMIISNDFSLFYKGYVKTMADAAGKKSLFATPHVDHKRIRRLISDPFSMNSLSNYIQKFDKMLCHRLKKVEQKNKSFKVLDFSREMTFDAICNMLMSITDEWLLRKMEKDCIAVSRAILSIPVMIPGTIYYIGMKARKRVMETFREMIDRRRSGKEFHEDFLQSMLERDSYPPNEKLDDVEIMDNLLTLILSGQSTTPAAMMWSVKFLGDNRQVQDRLREEQLSVARNKESEASLTLEDITKMSYGSKVVKETLRMANVVLWLPRVAFDDCKIQGFEIKKGWHVNIDAACIHYDPDLYPEPMQFNPSRFDEAQKPYSFLPYGSGARTCLGMNMAKVTILVFLHRLTIGYKWTLDDQDTSLEKNSFIPILRSGCPITLRAL